MFGDYLQAIQIIKNLQAYIREKYGRNPYDNEANCDWIGQRCEVLDEAIAAIQDAWDHEERLYCQYVETLSKEERENDDTLN